MHGFCDVLEEGASKVHLPVKNPISAIVPGPGAALQLVLLGTGLA